MHTSSNLLELAQNLTAVDQPKQETFLDTAIEVDSFVESNDGYNTVRHTAIIPEDFAYNTLADSNIPIQCTYPFKLDKFQELALQCLERDESLLVSAHTSAGKTLVAEYAIHLSIQRKQRVIYTSPIKALSNQKYRELNEKFGDVGLMTGDVTLNPDSTCIVMTTEILRNMIYRGTEILRETHFVVFDEVHYMRDRERGVVWEETIILLPSTIRFIFLSATIPNAEEFARWIVSIHKQPCHVIYTEKRPTPLEHYVYVNAPGKASVIKPGGQLKSISDQLFVMVDKDGAFQSKNIARIQQRPAGSTGYTRRREMINVVDILRILKSTNNLPTIIFSFRRKECEVYAMVAEKEFDFNTEEDKEMIDTIFTNALTTLREEDRKLPQILGLKALLLRGIGVHHSGLMPIVKEIIEILFQENLLKVLFATETFSIGLNMPAKSVIFTSIKKFDGVQTRFITSGEYIQMSGRAGRRGTDKIGNVILALESTLTLSEKEIKKVLHGPSNTLDSAFKLSYNTILNILRLDGMDEDHVIKHSFLQFRYEMRGKALYLLMHKYIDELGRVTRIFDQETVGMKNTEHIKKYCDIKQQEINCRKDCTPALATLNRVLVPGKIVEIEVRRPKVREIGREITVEYPDVVMGGSKILAIIMERADDNLVLMTEDENIIEAEVSCIRNIAKTSLEVKAKKSKSRFFREFFNESKKKNKQLLETLTFYTPMELGIPEEMAAIADKLEKAAEYIYDGYIRPLNPMEKDKVFKLMDMLFYTHELRRKIESLAKEKEQTRLVMIEEYNNKRKILQGLFYLSQKEVLIKGKVASEISSGDELLLTEMLFNNEFSKLSPGRICSLLSCVVFDDKSDKITLTPESESALKILTQTVDRLVTEFERLDMNFKAKEYTEKFCCNLMDVVYRWTEGYSFAEICETTEVFEGSIIRCFRRLEEVLKEMSRASKVIGNVEMENKFSAAISLVKRDIVFANSLYL
ncbi:ATP-dependent RNA helicase DOB1 [Nematocida sp. AWRm78]|nr:ATP-dependent RNA helicase DOB1 [Nematocida sp. AWRm79]KAI5185334.1 ATP-dependent RNA helicase DOB1 [Nematocida sp. AWRm78]